MYVDKQQTQQYVLAISFCFIGVLAKVSNRAYFKHNQALFWWEVVSGHRHSCLFDSEEEATTD